MITATGEKWEALEQAARDLHSARYPIALTGAGMSTPSGIPDFRSPQAGLWENADPMVVASIYGFRQKPEAFFEWIRPLARCLMEARPNPAHLALAAMEKMGFIKTIITQNIDMLHSRAGSTNVLEVHGHLREATCGTCFECVRIEHFLDVFIETGAIPYCPTCGGILKPNVILFGEQLPASVLESAESAVRQCDVMLVAGSSLSVAPISDLPRRARKHGAKLILINYEETHMDQLADVVIHDDVAVALPRLVDLLEVED